VRRATRRLAALEDAHDELVTQGFYAADVPAVGWTPPETNEQIDKAWDVVTRDLTRDALFALQELIAALGRAARERGLGE
jgi:hypothetical protein